MTCALGDKPFMRGTRAFRPSATPHDAVTAVKYDWTIADVGMGVDLFALEKLIPTLSDWLVICHARVPAVWVALVRPSSLRSDVNQFLTPRPGVSIPAVTTKLDRTKHDMRNGKKTGKPVSWNLVNCATQSVVCVCAIPGWSVESIVFFACHRSGVMSWIFPILYAVTSCFAFSRPAEDVNSVLRSYHQSHAFCTLHMSAAMTVTIQKFKRKSY